MITLKTFLGEARLYLCNHLITNIPSHRIRLAFYRHVMSYNLSTGVSLHLGVRFDCTGKLVIGNNTVVNENCRLDPRGSISIGCNVSISADVIILTADHHIDSPTFEPRLSAVTISDYAFIGTRAMIMPGVSVGEGSVVAAGAVVTKDVLPYTVVGGVPATLIKRRKRNLSYNTEYKRLFH